MAFDSEAFNQELEALVNRYPEIVSMIAAEAEENDEDVDLKAPMTLTGSILVLKYTTVHGVEMLTTQSPEGQSYYLTIGLLHGALRMLGG